MKKASFLVGILMAAAMVAPLAAQAEKPYQRFDSSALYENTPYQPGQKFCVERRMIKDGQMVPAAQYRVIGINEVNADKFGNCDADAIKHQPTDAVSAQFEWERVNGRKLFTAWDKNLDYKFSPGSLFCKHYYMYKVDHKGNLKGTGRTCGTIEEPTMDPR
jgi:hypothetical protein